MWLGWPWISSWTQSSPESTDVTTRLVVSNREYKNGIDQCILFLEEGDGRHYYECLLSDNLQGLIVSQAACQKNDDNDITKVQVVERQWLGDLQGDQSKELTTR
jgi:hypothetical protein